VLSQNVREQVFAHASDGIRPPVTHIDIIPGF
jgi:hypothetical protein